MFLDCAIDKLHTLWVGTIILCCSLSSPDLVQLKNFTCFQLKKKKKGLTCFQLKKVGLTCFHSLYHIKSPIQFQIQSDNPVSCYKKPVEETNETAYPFISLIHPTGFPQQLIGALTFFFFFFGRPFFVPKSCRVSAFNYCHEISHLHCGSSATGT